MGNYYKINLANFSTASNERTDAAARPDSTPIGTYPISAVAETGPDCMLGDDDSSLATAQRGGNLVQSASCRQDAAELVSPLSGEDEQIFRN